MLQEAEVANSDTYLPADGSKINEDDNNMNISMEGNQETMKYQNNLKVDVKNITNN